MRFDKAFERVRKRLTEEEWNYSDMSREMDMSRYTIHNIISGRTPNPGVLTVQKIDDYMENNHDQKNKTQRPTK